VSRRPRSIGRGLIRGFRVNLAFNGLRENEKFDDVLLLVGA
jgi:hypothetical protein